MKNCENIQHYDNNEKNTAIEQNWLKNSKVYPVVRISRSLSIISTRKRRAQVYEYKIFKNLAYTAKLARRGL